MAGSGTEEERQPYFTPPPQGARLFLRRFGLRALARVRFWLGEEEAFGARFLFLPFFLSAGIIIYFNLPYEADWSEITAFCSLAGGLSLLLRQKRFWQLICLFIVCIGLGALFAKAETARFSTIMLRQSGFTHIKGRIYGLERRDKGGYWLNLRLLASAAPALEPPPQNLRLSAKQLPEDIGLGGGAEGLVFIRSFSGPVRPGAYDFAFQNYFRGLGGQGNFIGLPQSVSLPPPSLAERAFLRIDSLRAELAARIIRAIGGERGAVAAALIVGERAGIAPATNQALRTAGLAHILAISGLHMAMAAGMVLALCRLILGLFPVFSSYYPPKKIAAGCALFAAAFYLLLSGAAIAAERSFIMVAVMLLAVICDRTAVSLRNLAISACIIMAWRPHEIMGPSFQMSFAATAALISAFSSWSLWRRRQREAAAIKARERGLPPPLYRPPPKMRLYLQTWIAAPLLSTCLSSLVAGLAGGLYSAYHFNNTAPFGILSNALALPLMAAVVMPFALLGMALMPLHLEALPLKIMGFGIGGIEDIAYWVAGFSPDGNLGYISPAALACLTAGMALLVFLRTPLRRFGCVFLGAGAAIYTLTPPPLALIAENGRLLSAFTLEGDLGLSSSRAAQFTVKIWQANFAASAVKLPQKMGEAAEAAGDSGAARVNIRPNAEKAEMIGYFYCADNFCRARLADGQILTEAESPAAQARACREGDIIMLNFIETGAEAAGAKAQSGAPMADKEEKDLCAGKMLITPRDLALFGAAEIRPALLRGHSGRGAAKIIWSVPAPNRPWNNYRRFSKRAQSLPS